MGEMYTLFEFAPGADTVGFLGYIVMSTDPAFYIRRTYVQGTISGAPRAGCWSTPFAVLFPPNADSVVFASVCGIHRSTNRRLTWDTLYGYSNIGSAKKLLAFDERSSQTVYMSDAQPPSYRPSVFRSTNQGRTWNMIFSIDADYSSSQFTLHAKGDTVLVGARSYLADTTRGVYRTTNLGTTWSGVYNRGHVTRIVKSRVAPTTLFAASEEGILKSTDYGAMWTMYNNALPTRRLTSLIISPYSDTMFVSTETHGVLKVWNYLTGVEETKTVPTECRLYQNYPNPFNPSTTIRFEVGGLGFVSLKVFDLLGREVVTLVNQENEGGEL
jgi:hypothetical protein